MTSHQEEIIYTDGHGIKITDRNFYTKDQTYLIEGITDVRLIRRPAATWPVILLFLLGVAGMLAGAYEMLANQTLTFTDSVYVVDTNTVALVTGIVFVLLSIVVFVMTRDRYAVGIRTAEGMRQPVKSKKKEYARHLVNLLQSAYRDHKAPSRTTSQSHDRITPVVH